jgi:hypothetical protein
MEPDISRFAGTLRLHGFFEDLFQGSLPGGGLLYDLAKARVTYEQINPHSPGG